MVSRDYTQELGMAPRTKRVPLPIAIAIIAVIGAGVWYGVSRNYVLSSEHQPKEAPPAAQPPPPAK